ncbi:phosphopentomutase [Lacticaseibacillus zhaodongensis]|uniref:phosphopentomutase n=1 Tax=Lacticaseibacillus zhaodongensis TaxID=2668065 RepID=UPI0012D2CAB5|nr:phosphopentomutase [Lacticaseibacillus zhaodongensis]
MTKNNPHFARIFAIVTDSAGIGAAPDAAKYDDVGADTYGHISDFKGPDWQLPNLLKLGLGNIRADSPMSGLKPVAKPLGAYGKMQEISAGKDSMDGHWEMMGLPVMEPLGFFPNGFPQELLDQITAFSGRKCIVNKPYSGTQVIHDYGDEQLKTGDLIVYTSGDSVLQIAANVDVIPLEELRRICAYARSITISAPYHIGRVIQRPYTYIDKDHFTRTSDRHDYTLLPNAPTDLDRLQRAGVPTYGIGKINDIFSGQGLDDGVHTVSNHDGMEQTIAAVKSDRTGFIFTNLVDFDAMYGHRRNAEGYAQALSEFDEQLGELLPELRPDDLLLITSDHGNDPTFKGTDHTREFVPLLAYSPSMSGDVNLGIRKPFSDLGATICENFGVISGKYGSSFLDQLV